ncbi:MAG: hypothetical protein ABI836_16280 [Gemmatimonadota bacterium]
MRALFRLIGCLGLILLLVAGWLYRDRVVEFVRGRLHKPVVAAAESVGRPSEAGVRRALDKVDSLNAWRADSVVITASEMASLIGAGLDPAFRGHMDSLQVGLEEGRIRVEASFDTSQIPKDMLGPLGGMVGNREHLKAAGPVAITRPGQAEWQVDQLTLGSFPFPRDVIPRLLERATGSHDAALPVMIPQGISAVAIHSTGVTLYGKTNRQ